MDSAAATMQHFEYSRPTTLENSREYFLRANFQGIEDPGFEPVKFIAFTSCPGVIIVCDKFGNMLRIGRQKLFAKEAEK
jgi:hypothetical protein